MLIDGLWAATGARQAPCYTALVTIVSGLLTAFGAGDLVPFIGPAVGIVAVIALVSAVASFISHRDKTNTLVAAGIRP